MIDREKVVSVLHKRFPLASSLDIAAATNAIVGLHPEYEPLEATQISAFDCTTSHARYGIEEVATGRLRIYRQIEDQG